MYLETLILVRMEPSELVETLESLNVPEEVKLATTAAEEHLLY